MTNALANRAARLPTATEPTVPVLPTVPPALSSALSRAMEPSAERGALFPLAGQAWDLAQATAAQIEDAIAVPVTRTIFAAWLEPLRWGVRNPPTDGEFESRRAALFELLQDLPAAAFTPDARIGVATEFFPSAVDIRRAVKPFADRARATIDGLRLIPKGEPAIAIEAPPRDPDDLVPSVHAFRARQRLMDGHLARTGRGVPAADQGDE